MVSLLRNLIHSLIILGIIAGEWYGIEPMRNLALAGCWIHIAMYFDTLILLDKEVLKKEYEKVSENIKTISKIINIVILALLFAVGWFVTGAFYLLGWVLFLAELSGDSGKNG